MRMNVKDFGPVQGMSVGHFGSSALVVVHAYAAEKDFAKLAPTFSQIAHSLRFDPDAAWREPPGFDWSSLAGKTASGAIIGAIVGALAYVFKKKSRIKTGT